MTTASVTNGFIIINFDGFTEINPRWNSPAIFKAEKQYGGGQEIKDGGPKSETYVFDFWFKADAGYPDTANTRSAYQKWEQFKKMLITPNQTYGYQRKITFEKPDSSGTTTINGKFSKPIAMSWSEGNDEYKVAGSFEFALDTDDTEGNHQVP